MTAIISYHYFSSSLPHFVCPPNPNCSTELNHGKVPVSVKKNQYDA